MSILGGCKMYVFSPASPSMCTHLPVPLPQYLTLFSPEEVQIIQTNVAVMQNEIRVAHRRALDGSHHGFGRLVSEVRGTTGRPRLVIDEGFLRWAYNYRSTSGIAAFLNVSRPTVRNALLDYGIAEAGEDPFIRIPLAPNGPSNGVSSK